VWQSTSKPTAYGGPCSECSLIHELEITPSLKQAQKEFIQKLHFPYKYLDHATQIFLETVEEHGGKMLGLMQAEDQQGHTHLIQAFSGQGGSYEVLPGWAPPLARVQTPDIRLVEKDIEDLGYQIQALSNSIKPLAARMEVEQAGIEQERLSIQRIRGLQRRYRKKLRSSITQEPNTMSAKESLARLDAHSQWVKKNIKTRHRHHRRILQAYKAEIETLRNEARIVRDRRRGLSVELTIQIHDRYLLKNARGESRSLSVFFTGSPPTGAGDCCAPKLLNHAREQGWEPQSMVEFWWGPDRDELGYVRAQAVGPCRDKCLPILGFLLCGLKSVQSHAPGHESHEVEIIHREHDFVVISKPSGLLSVPGRQPMTQGCVLDRVRQLLKLPQPPLHVHRLDRDTSGLMVVALTREAQRSFGHLFEKGLVDKRYEAIVEGCVEQKQGCIKLKQGPDRLEPPRQKLCSDGKMGITHWRVLKCISTHTRVELSPLTGRTHQLRLHMSIGLKHPIKGDPLYGNAQSAERLMLHARDLSFPHPFSQKKMTFHSPAPF
jgi:tRNA pseudouridine32 synthase / 23S rRNA pseudouridine746 synthase